MGHPEPYPAPSQCWRQLLDAAATVQAPLAAVDWAGLENSCETKAHTFPTEVDYWCLLLVPLCSHSSVLDLGQRTDLTGVQPLPVSCFSGVIVFICDDRCSLLPALPDTAQVQSTSW